ncbi:uncharacterized protein BDZ99DRAFT_24991 [Mytilinidion resinicola]|uniref:DUF7730 domain-containing protein n=1 Tax=Mytilinidion resinicola TaxID=574789 RepID=A0A6A6ZBA4_9PEZI|nr:uncharacterized protein BDZ99DRAFT_24991 [Mytilinidion resinicola]KAF2817983.1 hypothetical protein BDZ99DRAFT_24991 [Mytilinidion resinicola]
MRAVFSSIPGRPLTMDGMPSPHPHKTCTFCNDPIYGTLDGLNHFLAHRAACRFPPYGRASRVFCRLDSLLHSESEQRLRATQRTQYCFERTTTFWNGVGPEVRFPFGLLKHRPRALTRPPSPSRPSNTKQSNNPQVQSPLFSRLPLEIRKMIYEEAIGKSVIHLEIRDHRYVVGHALCPEPKSGKCGCRYCRYLTCRRIRKTANPLPYLFSHTLCPEPEQGKCGCRYLKRRGARKTMNPLPLLLSCRMIYSEAIDLLYSSNSFAFRHDAGGPLVILPDLLLPQRFHAIRSLSLFWVPDFWVSLDPPSRLTEEWEFAWKVIASMKGLQTVYVDLAQDGLMRPDLERLQEFKAQIIEPVKAITTPLKAFRMVWPHEGFPKTVEVGGKVWEIETLDKATMWVDATLGRIKKLGYT